MSQPFIGEVRAFGFDFVPTGWTLCNGALVSIIENHALCGLLVPKYGGHCATDLALPNLSGIQIEGSGAETAYYIALTGADPPRG